MRWVPKAKGVLIPVALIAGSTALVVGCERSVAKPSAKAEDNP
jgi:hypothetical protein